MVGIVNNQVKYTPLKEAVKYIEKIDPQLVKMMEVLSY